MARAIPGRQTSLSRGQILAAWRQEPYRASGHLASLHAGKTIGKSRTPCFVQGAEITHQKLGYSVSPVLYSPRGYACSLTYGVRWIASPRCPVIRHKLWTNHKIRKSIAFCRPARSPKCGDVADASLSCFQLAQIDSCCRRRSTLTLTVW